MQKVIQLSIAPLGMINCFLIQGEKKHILVDTGLPGSETKILQQLQTHNIRTEDISLIIITHGHVDHFGSVRALKKTLQAPVLVHELDKQALETGIGMIETLKPTSKFWDIALKPRIRKSKAGSCTPDIVLKGDAIFDLSTYGIHGKVIHTPGHTPGSLSVILDDGNAIIMDIASSGILLGGIAFNNRMKHPPFHNDMTIVKKSIDYILSFPVQKFFLGHGNPVSRTSLEKYKGMLD
jgi:hydroxyacylglutathione hydrolase